ncbi:hypothetical protein PROFUN_16727, partial [Planoprotostelium fungivorum]
PTLITQEERTIQQLTTKIMTGTIWTNKRKKQYKLTEDDRQLNDQLWATLKQFWDKTVVNWLRAKKLDKTYDRGQVPTPSGLRDPTPPRQQSQPYQKNSHTPPNCRVQSYQLASNGLVAPNTGSN